jgi:signal transduction histidine kinase
MSGEPGNGSAYAPPGSSRERLTLLRRVAAFGELQDDDLLTVAAKLTVVDLVPGGRLFDKGAVSDAMYVVVDGSIRIHDDDYTFTHIEPPECFGEYALFHDSPRTASATARVKTTLFKIDRALFASELRENNAFLRGLLHATLRRIIEKDATEEQISANREKLRAQRDQIASQCDELERKRLELAQINAVKDKFFSIIAHDLKSPLMSLTMMSRALSERPAYLTPEKAQEYANLVHRSATIACRLMENLLDWSRSQTNSIHFTMEPVNLHKAVRENFALLDICAQQKSVALCNEVPEELRAYADVQSVSAIARNLVSNAVKYTAPGGRVTASARAVQACVEWSISDTGVGIEPHRLGKVFGEEGCGSTRGTADEMGTGLGLKLCKEFAEKNNGQIRVISEAGKGTTFLVTLPKA